MYLYHTHPPGLPRPLILDPDQLCGGAARLMVLEESNQTTYANDDGDMRLGFSKPSEVIFGLGILQT